MEIPGNLLTPMEVKENKTLTIPLGLRHAMESWECVLFLGAGIGGHLSDEAGCNAPSGSDLAAELAEHFEIDTDGSTDLSKISRVIEIRKKGRKELYAFLQKRLANLTPDENLRWLLGRPWKAIFTTNYDSGIERAYEMNPKPIQTPVVASVTADLAPVNPIFEVPLFHLHGTLFGTADPHIIITEDDYAAFRERRRMLFELLKTEFATSTLLYIGYSHNDSNWKILLNELSSELEGLGIPLSYRISPTTPSLDIEILKAKGIETLAADLVTFVRSVRLELVDIPLAADHLKALQSAIPADLTVQFEKSPAATARLLSSWTYVNQAPFNESPNVAQFLRGDQGNWGLIAERDFFERDIEETVYDELLDYATSKSTSGRSLAILGPAGYGTSTLSATLAVKLAHDRAGRVFMHKPGTPFLAGC